MAELDLNRPKAQADAAVSNWRADRDRIGADYSAPEVARLIDIRLVDGWPLAYTRRGRLMRRHGHVETMLLGTSWGAAE